MVDGPATCVTSSNTNSTVTGSTPAEVKLNVGGVAPEVPVADRSLPYESKVRTPSPVIPVGPPAVQVHSFGFAVFSKVMFTA